ncbi:MAG: hypothetical protein K8S54_17340 [Spirochaetia bacterium]|nr:hypothetical protein [Spirochaetia bacterium]
MTELADHLKALSSFEFASELRRISDLAGDGDAPSQESLESLVKNCSADAWKVNARFCAAVTSALIQTGTHRSMLFMMRYLSALPGSIPFGAVELFSSHLPLYGARLLPTLRQMADSEEEASRAVGIQTLCNMYFERKLQAEDETFLQSRLEQFKDDRYSTGHFAELVRSDMAARSPEDGERFANGILIDG